MIDHGRVINGCPAWREHKDPEDVEQYGVDLTDWLDGEILQNASYSVEVSSGLSIDAQHLEGNIAYVLVSSGNVGIQKVKLTAQTSVRTRVRDILLEVKDC